MADKELKQRVREIIETEEEVNYKKRMGDEWTNALKPIGTDWNKGYLTTVPYIVLLFKQVYGFKDDGKKKNHYYNEISCSISAGELSKSCQILVQGVDHATNKPNV